MAKKNSTTSSKTKKAILTILFFLLGIFFTLAMFHKAGVAGDLLQTYISRGLFGFLFPFLPIVFFLLGFSFIRSEHLRIPLRFWIGGTTILLSFLGILDILFPTQKAGGMLGKIVAIPFEKLFDIYGGVIILGAILLSTVLILLELGLPEIPAGKMSGFMRKLWELARTPVSSFFKKKDTSDSMYSADDFQNIDTLPEENSPVEEIKEVATPEPQIPETPIESDKDDASFEIKKEKRRPRLVPFTPPPISLLERDKGKPLVGDIKANANIIKRTLANFGIQVEMDEISIGPTVTRYALKPAEGMKLSRIVGLQNDLALALAAHPIRIEAPIPGKSLVGIEIPNKSKSTIGLGTLVSDEKFTSSDKPLLLTLGKGVTGKAYFGDLAKAPHLLIAGATGSGKSVTIHSLVTSLLYRNPPEDLRFIMIDPKRVELTLYNKIPHLLTPVITDAKKAILALKWAAKEMDRRYDILEAESVRDIGSYHTNVVRPAYEKAARKGENDSDGELPERMPYIAIFIDELADIMQAYPRELESAIVRLAQMSRAVGIHLVLSTQRPSVNVITGLIKANVPSRIALQVSSQIDSRTILDTSGAEKLLGAGDMLYLSGEMSKPERMQSAFISEEEVKAVVKYLANAYKDEIPQEEMILPDTMSEGKTLFDDDADSGDDDDLYEQAREVIIQAGKGSTSYLQRKLKVGYARAARLMDMLEERGVIGPADGAKPREVLSAMTDQGYGRDEENNL